MGNQKQGRIQAKRRLSRQSSNRRNREKLVRGTILPVLQPFLVRKNRRTAPACAHAKRTFCNQKEVFRKDFRPKTPQAWNGSGNRWSKPRHSWSRIGRKADFQY